MSAFAMAARQVRHESRSFRRNPPAAFFTVAFPLMFLVIFNLMFGDYEIEVSGGTTSVSTFYVPAIVTLSIINACYTNLAMTVSITRDLGVLKRLRGTPMPQWVYFAGVIGHATLLSTILVGVVVAAGTVFYDVELPRSTAPAFVVSIVIGTATFSALGLALTGFIRDSDASPAIVNATVLPLLFISDVFITPGNAPDWLSFIADLFPVKHLSAALFASFNPFEDGPGFRPSDLAVLAAWGIVGVALTLRSFRWEPRH